MIRNTVAPIAFLDSSEVVGGFLTRWRLLGLHAIGLGFSFFMF